MDISTREKLRYVCQDDSISITGRTRIAKKLCCDYDLVLPEDWSWAWDIKEKAEGSRDILGTLPKRISRWAWNNYRCKISKEHASVIGNIGSTYRGKKSGFGFSFTDKIDWEAGDFGDDGSCFWSCHSSAKDIITDHGGGAIKFYETTNGSTDWLRGIARAWFLPHGTCGDFMVFNGYGYTTLEISQAVSACLGYNHESICLSNFGDPDGRLWINNGAAYLIGPSIKRKEYEKNKDNLRHVDLELKDIRYRCQNCAHSSVSDDTFTPISPGTTDPGTEYYCKTCMDKYYTKCKECKTVFYKKDTAGPLCDVCRPRTKGLVAPSVCGRSFLAAREPINAELNHGGVLQYRCD